MTRKFFIGIFFSLSLFGCASGPSFTAVPQKDNESVLYIYRLLGIGNGGERPSVHLNDKKLVVLSDGGYTYVRLSPGRHNLKLYKYGLVSGEAAEPYFDMNFNVDESANYYFRWTTETSGYHPSFTTFSFKNEYGFVESATGSNEIKKTRLIEPALNNRQGSL